MSTILFIAAPFIGIAAAFGLLWWALGSHRRERAPWLALLQQPGVIEGQVTHGVDLFAPFSQRRCLGFTCEIITQEFFGNSVTWRRVLEHSAGRFGVGEREVDLTSGRALFPVPLEEHGKFSLDLRSTVFHGTPSELPPHITAFVQTLDPATQQIIYRPSGQIVGGKRIYFNEQIVIPGQQVVVAAGPCLGLGTVASERARIAKLPIASELFGAIMAGVIAAAAVCFVASVLAH